MASAFQSWHHYRKTQAEKKASINRALCHWKSQGLFQVFHLFAFRVMLLYLWHVLSNWEFWWKKNGLTRQEEIDTRQSLPNFWLHCLKFLIFSVKQGLRSPSMRSMYAMHEKDYCPLLFLHPQYRLFWNCCWNKTNCQKIFGHGLHSSVQAFSCWKEFMWWKVSLNMAERYHHRSLVQKAIWAWSEHTKLQAMNMDKIARCLAYWRQRILSKSFTQWFHHLTTQKLAAKQVRFFYQWGREKMQNHIGNEFGPWI